MKKILLCVLSLLPTIMLSSSFNNLEHAIQDSDIELVETILSEIQLTDYDQKCLVILSHDIVSKRKSDLEISTIKPSFRISSVRKLLTKYNRGPKLMALGCIINTLSCITFKLSQDHDIDFLAWVSGVSLLGGAGAMCTALLLSLYDFNNILENDYNNAIKIKQLILHARESNNFVLTA